MQKSQEKERKEKEGYFTVEASLILPVVLVVLALVLELSFALYQSCFYHQTAYLAALRGALKSGSNEEKYAAAAESLEMLQKRQLIGEPGRTQEITAGALYVQIRLRVERAFAFPGFDVWKEKFWKQEIVQKAWNRDPVLYIRERRRGTGGT